MMTLSRILAVALVAVAVTAPTTNARPIDPGGAAQRAADAERAASLTQERYYGSYGDQTRKPRQDLRSPDTRDAAVGRGTFNAPEVTIVRVPQSAPSSSGIHWQDATMGAGTVLALTLVAFAGALAVAHRRRRGRATAMPG
jgi:hypothetical protein